jgi:hypothetical protein
MIATVDLDTARTLLKARAPGTAMGLDDATAYALAE